MSGMRSASHGVTERHVTDATRRAEQSDEPKGLVPPPSHQCRQTASRPLHRSATRPPWRTTRRQASSSSWSRCRSASGSRSPPERRSSRASSPGSSADWSSRCSLEALARHAVEATEPRHTVLRALRGDEGEQVRRRPEQSRMALVRRSCLACRRAYFRSRTWSWPSDRRDYELRRRSNGTEAV